VYTASNEIEDYLLHCRRILEPLGNWCAETLSVAGVRVHKPTGAFYLFPDFSPLREALKTRGVTTSKQMCELLLEETGAAILTGEAFCRPEDDLTARLAYVNFDGTAVLQASREVPLEQELDESFFRKHGQKTLKGIEVIAEWCRDLV
jgi:aspartate aminotransferase